MAIRSLDKLPEFNDSALHGLEKLRAVERADIKIQNREQKGSGSYNQITGFVLGKTSTNQVVVSATALRIGRMAVIDPAQDGDEVYRYDLSKIISYEILERFSSNP